MSSLRPISPKRAIENRVYEKNKRQWRKQHDGRCEMIVLKNGNPTYRVDAWAERVIMGADPREPHRCRARADRNPHHIRGRGSKSDRCDIKNFMGLCPAHHRWVTDHLKQAEALGYFIREYDKH